MHDLFVITPLNDALRDALSPHFRIHHADDMDDPAAWLAENGAGISYALGEGGLKFHNAYLDRLPDLKLISSVGVGYDGIDTAATTARGVIVTHTPNVLNDEVATTALMLLIACYREFNANVAHATSGAWATKGNMPPSRSVDHRTIGILGLGRIGQAIADKLAPFHAKILYHGRSERDLPYTYYADLTEMARDADALICVVPGGASTHHLINAEVISALGPNGILVNVGRGTTVDESALIDALGAGRLGAAGLDVFEQEPNIPQALRDMSNVTLTPHIGSATVETRAAMMQLSVDNLLQHIKDGSVITPVPESAPLL